MGCCVDFDSARALIEEVVHQYYPDDAKIFVARREATGGLEKKVQVGIVVKPDDQKNSEMFDALIALSMRADSCMRMLYSQVDLRDTRIVDLFILEITTM